MSDESRDSNEAGRRGSGENDDVINRAATAIATAISNILIPKFIEITTALKGLHLSAISRDEAMTLIGQAEQRVEDFRKVTGSTSTRAAGLTERLQQFLANWRLGRIEGSRAPDLGAGDMVKPEAPRQVDLGVRLHKTHDETNGDPGTAE
uniref:Uncharacterized protein n=1 Tax=Chromera velia CCMP2878 TaxID=1169474 RepID=A0A0G4HNB8_9ALVE|eukprot:Cvel_29585.t1-p1 / transcript=Cvel_29585.t1 / gene=Cvel_29585 / organism=Chromera_velia_CCMP2878 / gene_product=hypothetical protein / transcript_product=hypothetical protein / location=Cvel_scaffold4074:468-1568(+) / protein_length=149 / sequence_SO=supercontig / SO=protein_coding / is_pseudo=false